MSRAQIPQVREEINEIFGRSEPSEQRVKQTIEGEEDDEVVEEVSDKIEEETEEIQNQVQIQQEIDNVANLPFGDMIGDGEMQPFESSDVTMHEITASLSNLQEAQETLASKVAEYEGKYQDLVDNADADSYAEEEIIATDLYKNRIFFETMIDLLDDVGEMLEETIEIIKRAISMNPEKTLGIGRALDDEEREAIAGEIKQHEHGESVDISARDRLNTGAGGGLSRDRKVLRESAGGMDPIENNGNLDDIARETLEEQGTTDENDGDDGDDREDSEDENQPPGPF
jgi:hypothetical protein